MIREHAWCGKQLDDKDIKLRCLVMFWHRLVDSSKGAPRAKLVHDAQAVDHVSSHGNVTAARLLDADEKLTAE